ncbi:MAG: matrixin family metalloprotease [Deltaproteobacteria bacterium]|nr:matrixin family metalloprotease [Deltaproteobacteria bacterium]MBN2672832.1 matrixin family metalloprotease [Deltaproteobacteria bacterium]
MKILFLSLFISLFAIPAAAFTVRTTPTGELVKWESDEIDVYLSPSLEVLGPSEEVYFGIVDAFETWIYEAEIDLQVNFIYGDCEAGYSALSKNTNCIYASLEPSSSNEDAGANASITYSQVNGEIYDGDIAFYQGAGNWKFEDYDEGLDFKHVALHEIGHFLGLTHSQISKAVMYPTVNLHTFQVSNLHEDDIYGALALYDTRKLDEQSACQFAPTHRNPRSATAGNLLTLLLSLLF